MTGDGRVLRGDVGAVGYAPKDRERGGGGVIRSEIERRRHFTAQRWAALNLLATGFSDLAEISDRAFIYITGSMAREEATTGSDLDLFVVDCLKGGTRCAADDGHCDHLDYVETSRLVSRLDAVREDAGFRRFSRGGAFIRTHHLSRLVELMGDPLDDAENAFTARVLLLINSRPLWNAAAYEQARSRILDSYWKPQDPQGVFRPIMLMNDIRRWWSVLCLNFERYNKPQVVDDYSARSPASRRIANLKLRYARMLACFSPLIALIDSADGEGLVTRRRVEEILNATPVERIVWLEDESVADETRALASQVLDHYDEYLRLMWAPDEELSRLVADDREWDVIKGSAYEFHRLFVALYRTVGEGRLLYEYSLI